MAMAAWLPSSFRRCAVVVALLVTAMAAPEAPAPLMYDQFKVTWGKEHSFFFMDGDGMDTLALYLDETHGSGFASNDAYLYGRFDIEIKLIENNSAGTVATLYLMPEDVPWDCHDEVDLEFLGNVTGEPYTLHTNIFVNGVGGREQQFRLWFDPTTDFHTYSIVWNPKHVLILDRAWTLWNADDWATQGGRVKTDWTQAPFYVYYRNFRFTPCAASPGVAWCGDEPPESTRFDRGIDEAALKKAREEHMLYNYCRDDKRFKEKGLPKECTRD
ncbi:hypothetical protein ACP70R_003147 [Stipagrostis hirtigluma subsp. patula]